MNPKVIKLKEERAKNCEKITSLQTRNKKIDADILSIENTDIIGMVRDVGLSPDMLAEFLAALKKNPVAQPNDSEETEDMSIRSRTHIPCTGRNCTGQGLGRSHFSTKQGMGEDVLRSTGQNCMGQ